MGEKVGPRQEFIRKHVLEDERRRPVTDGTWCETQTLSSWYTKSVKAVGCQQRGT